MTTAKHRSSPQPLPVTPKAVSLLVEHGADVNEQKGFALTCACYHGHVDVVRALLDAGGDTVARQRRWHGLHAACGWGEGSKPSVEIVRMLLDAGALPDRQFQGRTRSNMLKMPRRPRLSPY